MEVGMVKRVDIDQEMQQAYLDYAMSVIVARALPDARDGLKPVQRRILYAMYDMNLGANSAFKKSARVVGEVLGKYHPHGDVAVYEAMARLAQDFSMRYTLVDGQGNFGSIDGDPPAAMRYTEARLARFATDMLDQIDRNTVDFSDNFDGTLREPEVLPAALPNLLVNGATGIAVGMATSIPPHNLSEVIDALTYMLENWDGLDDVGVPDLMRFIKGPDFPTGGIILQEGPESALLTAYGSGKGRITVRGRVHSEDMGRGRVRLIITELPYQTNKTTLIERIADLVREGDLDGIADLRDESDRQGMRIVIELKQGAEMETTLRALYHRTPLQSTFGITLLALVDNEPRLLNLKQALRVFLEHRVVIVRRRSEYDLAKALSRQHILEGLRVALKNLDEIIALIRNAPDVEQARERLMKRYKLSEIQAQAILDMQLRRLASLERKKIEEEYKEVTATIKDLEALLKSPRRMRQVVEDELKAMRETYGDRRRTQIVSLKEGDSSKSLLTTTDLTPAEVVWVGVTADGRVGRTHGEQPLAQTPRFLAKVSTHDTLYLVSTQGQAAAVAAHTLPEVESFDSGAPLHKASALSEGDRLAILFHLPSATKEEGERFILTATRQGMLKKSPVSELPGPSAQRFILVKVNPEDELMGLAVTDGKSEIGLVSAQGMAIRFTEDDVRPMGLVAAGVMGMKLGEGDAIAGLVAWQDKAELALIASDGSGLRIAEKDFPKQGRYGQGVIGARVPKGTEIVGAVFGGAKSAVLVHFQRGEPRRVKFGDFPLLKRGGKPATVVSVRGVGEVVAMGSADAGEGKAPVKPVQSTLPGADAKPKKGAAAKKEAAAPVKPVVKPSGKAKPATAAPERPARGAGKPGASQSAPAPSRKTTAAAQQPATASGKKPSKPTTAESAPSKPAARRKSTAESAAPQAPEEKTTRARKTGTPAVTEKPVDAPSSSRGKKSPGVAQPAPEPPAAAKRKGGGASEPPTEQQILPGLEPPKPRKKK
ncbi:MAG: DNA topoisomerase 4 subunit A [Anaerolineae bacterium]|nr:DNA topoisomerase 4 subunit A [Anaerolineae bacterium]